MKKTSVEEFILNSGKWQASLNMLREILLSLEMEETVKWSTPVYCVDGKNVVGMGHFKAYTGLWFFQGVFLQDKKKKLLSGGDETKGMRQWRFSSEDEIENELDLIIEYLKEAAENSRLGKELKPKKNKPFDIPDELLNAFELNPNLKNSFEILSHSKKRDFAHYIGQAKKSETRIRRLKKCIPIILEGKGLMDQYK